MMKTVSLDTLIASAPLKKCGNGKYPVLSMTMHDGIMLQSDRFKKYLASSDTSNYKIVHRNQLVEGFPIDEGVIYVQKIVDDGIMSPAYRVWDIDVAKIEPDYLELALHSGKAMQYYRTKLRGTTARRRSLPTPTLLAMEIPLPSREEQRHSIMMLNDAQEAINTLNMLQAEIDNIVKSRFIEMFGDLALNPMNWETMPIVEVCANKDDIKCGPFGTQLGKHEYVREGVPLWGIPQINAAFAIPPTDFLTKEKAEQLSAYSLVPGDIAMSRKGNVGKCAIYPDGEPNGIIHSDVLRIRVNSEVCNPIFLMCQLHFSHAIEPQIDAVSNGAVMAGINVTKLKNINVHVPPIELQNQFAEFVQLADKSELVIRELLEQHQLLKEALMQKYFG